ncbi:MAG TPA: GTP 3',8-cyclase MoaA [Conexivisphaerales archaeon]|nr:GTP 3',8-cyclase MoaA [Conexivisphaerales archaeon]
MVLIDRYNRPVTALRIALTPECNFDCVFCHNEGFVGHAKDLLTATEIARVASILMQFGVRKVKLTGGEPMTRSDIVEITQKLGALRPDDLAMTTNGTRIESLATQLKEAGMMRLNISLHSLKEERFKWITTSVRYEETLDAIRKAIEVGLTPVKLNMVLMKGYNTDEVWDMVDYAESLGGGDTAIVQFIELVPVDIEFYRRFHYDPAHLEEELKERAVSVKIRELQNRPQYTLPNGVKVEIVKPVHNVSFCIANNRMRITHDGKFRPCLMRDDNMVDFMKLLRSASSDQAIADQFVKSVWVREPYYKLPELRPAQTISVR